MARLIRSTNTPIVNVTIQTMFEDGSYTDEILKIYGKGE